MRIDIVSDLVCPWCFVGKRHLEQAVSELPTLSPECAWHPFLLDSSVPAEGIPMQAYLARKFGGDDRVRPLLERLTDVGASAGVAFAFERIQTRPNSVHGHRLLDWAQQEGCQDEVAEALFAAYFEHGEDIGDPAVLAALAGQVGMDAEGVTRRLRTDDSVAKVHAAAREAQRAGVHGVPFFVMGRAIAVSGAQPPALLRDALERAHGLQPQLVSWPEQ